MYRMILLLVCFVTPNLVAAQPGRFDDDFDKLLQQLDAIRKQHNIPAYAIVVSSDKKIILDEVRGVSQAGSVKAVSRQAYFRIGSITKTFVALGALVAQAQGLKRFAKGRATSWQPWQFF
jgi:CubicO group peptidase (beta-lactamase class C family)